MRPCATSFFLAWRRLRAYISFAAAVEAFPHRPSIVLAHRPQRASLQPRAPSTCRIMEPSRRFFPASAAVLLLLLVAASAAATDAPAAKPPSRECEADSARFKGLCFVEENCASVCLTEGFTGGKCSGFRRHCMCTKQC